MLSFGGSAALDEMFGAHNSAAKGYCKAALLAELLQRQAARPWESAERTSATTSATAPASSRACSGSMQPSGRARSGGAAAEDTARGHEAGAEAVCASGTDSPAPEEGCSGWEAEESGPSSGTCGDDTCDELLVDALQHQGERSSTSGTVHGWDCDLDLEQQRLLREYRETIARRHSQCAHR